MLKRFGRYAVQYLFQIDAKGRAMRARKFADIQRRKLDERLDRLPIVANGYKYGVRFVSKEMRHRDCGVDLSLLTLYLLNGKILRNGQKIKKCSKEMDITNYIQYIAFDKFAPPGKIEHLSLLEKCRLVLVSLDRSGRFTEGYLWHRSEVSTRPSQWPRFRHWICERHCRGLNDFQRDCFLQLTNVLRLEGFDLLCSNIEGYLEADMVNARPKAARNYKDLMADSVVAAIRIDCSVQVAISEACTEPLRHIYR